MRTRRRREERIGAALADPYGTRRGVLEDQWKITPQLLAERGRELYPIAYPEVVKPLTEQFGLPPYYVYAVMTVSYTHLTLPTNREV